MLPRACIQKHSRPNRNVAANRSEAGREQIEPQAASQQALDRPVHQPLSHNRAEAEAEQIARELRSGYTIGIQPPDVADDGFRSIRVVADAGDGRQLVARTRAGYYAVR